MKKKFLVELRICIIIVLCIQSVLGLFQCFSETLEVNHLSCAEVTEYSADTAKANNLKPYDYFEYLLSEIPEHMGVIPTELFWINFYRGLKIFPNRSEKITSKSTVAKAAVLL